VIESAAARQIKAGVRILRTGFITTSSVGWLGRVMAVGELSTCGGLGDTGEVSPFDPEFP
jgi:hypothetical protein